MNKSTFLILIFLMTILPGCARALPTQVSEKQISATEVVAPTKEIPLVDKPIETSTIAEVATEETGVIVPQTEAATEEPSVEIKLDTTYENAVSVPVQLLCGILRLEGTDLALTKEQATDLLPLWQEFNTLTQSMASVQENLDDQRQTMATQQPEIASADVDEKIGVMVKQITAVMTLEQLNSIAEMKITPETAMTIMKRQGITMVGGPQESGNTGGLSGQPSQGGGPPPGRPGGENNGAQGALAGGQPAGNGQMMPLQGDEGRDEGMIPAQMINVLIQQLGKISGIEVAIDTTQHKQGANGPGRPGGSSSAPTDYAAAYKQSGGSETKSGQSYTASGTDESGIFVTDGGLLTLSNSTVTTNGNTSSQESSSFYGLNAAVLAFNNGTVNLSESTIATSGSGANGAFAVGSGSTVNLSKVTIKATGDGGHGVMATLGGTLTLSDVNINTSGKNSAPFATDRGSGAVKFTGGTVTSSGSDSPPIYSTGVIEVSNGTLSSTGSEAAVIEGGNSITLTDSDLSSSKEGKWGVMIYQSMSGDAEGTRGVFTMTGGSLGYSSTNGPLFYVTNSTGVISLKGVTINVGSGMLVKAAAGNWGTNGSNGGIVDFIADSQSLTGNMFADSISSLTVDLKNGSSLSGAVNSDNQAKEVNLTLDATSTWNLTGDSYLTCLTDVDGISGTTITNISSNGFTVYYSGSTCSALSGNTYTLNGGGLLKPAN